MGAIKKTMWTEEKIQNVLRCTFLSPSTKKYEVTNLYVYNWESDYLTLTRNGYVYEVEIKISKADFKNDTKHKVNKHALLENVSKSEKCIVGCPNYFYYAVPEDLIKPEEVPEYAGLIYVQPWGVKIVKESAKFNKEKQTPESLGLIDKFYFNYQTYQRKYEELADAREKIKKLKNEIKSYNKTIMDYDELLSDANNKIQGLENTIWRLRNNKEIL